MLKKILTEFWWHIEDSQYDEDVPVKTIVSDFIKDYRKQIVRDIKWYFTPKYIRKRMLMEDLNTLSKLFSEDEPSRS